MSPLPLASTVTQPRAHGLHARIGGVLYRLVDLADARPFIRTAAIQPPRIDTAQNPEDIRPEVGVFFSLSEFGGGEGQAHIHRPNSSPNRFWDSRGIDTNPPLPGRPATFSLLRTSDNLRATANTNVRADYNGTSLFLVDGNDVVRCDNPLGITPIFATENPHSGDGAVAVLDITHYGTDVYTAMGTSGVHKRDSIGTWTSWSTLAATRVWQAKGRVLGAVAEALHEVRATTTSDLLHTLSPGNTWTGAVDAGAYVIASATDGFIYSFTLDEATGNLSIANRTRVSTFEQVTALAYHPSGLVFYGTSEPTLNGTVGRLYRAAINESGTLSFSALVRQWGDSSTTADRAVHTITPYRESIYTAVDEPDRNTHLWRYDLETTGRVRHLDAQGDGPVPVIIPIGDRLFFTRENAGLYRESTTTYQSTGYLISSLADHFTSAQKNWAAVNIDVENLEGGVVELWYSSSPDAILNPDHSSWIRGKRVTTPNDILEVPISAVSRYLAVQVKIQSGLSSTSSPSIRSFVVRAYPGPNDIILELPVSTSDQIEIPGLRPIVAPNHGMSIYSSLRNIEGTNQSVELYSPAESIYGLVEEVATPVMALTSRGSRTLVTMVKVRGRRTGSTTTTTSTEGMGIDMMGVPVMGGIPSA